MDRVVFHDEKQVECAPPPATQCCSSDPEPFSHLPPLKLQDSCLEELQHLLGDICPTPHSSNPSNSQFFKDEAHSYPTSVTQGNAPDNAAFSVDILNDEHVRDLGAAPTSVAGTNSRGIEAIMKLKKNDLIVLSYLAFLVFSVAHDAHLHLSSALQDGVWDMPIDEVDKLLPLAPTGSFLAAPHAPTGSMNAEEFLGGLNLWDASLQEVLGDAYTPRLQAELQKNAFSTEYQGPQGLERQPTFSNLDSVISACEDVLHSLAPLDPVVDHIHRGEGLSGMDFPRKAGCFTQTHTRTTFKINGKLTPRKCIMRSILPMAVFSLTRISSIQAKINGKVKKLEQVTGTSNQNAGFDEIRAQTLLNQGIVIE
ncbi:hypothetical protein BSKO_03312 [Bryopsis sp. KO-2023]|nr:hypothetical protein BSKO_03312 [Bryopsis sp. KO-2023]